MSERPWAGRRLHFVGVGGAGMSGYARAAHVLGATVSGSDRADSSFLRHLHAEGVLDAAIGHSAANVPPGEGVEVFYSSAIPPENPERVSARERGLSERPRAELLAELTSLRPTIAVAGAHGKTTTASMIAWTLLHAGLHPSWLIGAPIGEGLENSCWDTASPDGWLVVEADESDRSMLSLHVDVAVLTNVELDHHATFGSLAELREDYRRFLALASTAVVAWDRPDLIDLTGPGARVVPFDVRDPELSQGGSVFAWGEQRVAIAVPGAHNARNALAALEAARLAGAAPSVAVSALERFRGAGRRFQRLGHTANGALVIDDYAHHPTEVAATIDAARTLDRGRVLAVFQPHLYSRTSMLARDFGAALARADTVVVLDVYPARERAEDHPGVSGLSIARAASERAEGRPVYWLASFEDAQRTLEGLLGPREVCLVMGAGDVDKLARSLVGDGS